MSDVKISLTFPLDSDGFLRRACPSCGREFKWRPDEPAGESVSVPEVYHCPYCRAVASPDEWFTPEQRAHIQDEVTEQVIGPSLDKLADSIRRTNRASGGLISGDIEIPHREHAPPIFEPNDMRVTKFPCHAEEPLKIAEDWTGHVHCLICGESTDAPTH
jgi:hypothetical protein